MGIDIKKKDIKDKFDTENVLFWYTPFIIALLYTNRWNYISLIPKSYGEGFWAEYGELILNFVYIYIAYIAILFFVLLFHTLFMEPLFNIPEPKSKLLKIIVKIIPYLAILVFLAIATALL